MRKYCVQSRIYSNVFRGFKLTGSLTHSSKKVLLLKSNILLVFFLKAKGLNWFFDFLKKQV